MSRMLTVTSALLLMSLTARADGPSMGGTITTRTHSTNPLDGPMRIGPAASSPTPASAAGDVERLIAGLGDPQWMKREIAGAQMIRLGSSAFDELRDAYRRSDRFEVRNRIKHVVYEIHLNERVGPVRAFLGISHYPADLTLDSDGRVPPGATALMFTKIVPESAAAMAGLIKGDLLLGLNGKRGDMDEPATAFVTWIGSQFPGATCTITIFRGGEGRILNKSILHGFDVRGFSRVPVRLVTSDEDARVPPGAAGLILEDVSRADPRLELRVGDLIISLDGKRLTSDSAVEKFNVWSQGSPRRADESEEDDAGPVVAPPQRVRIGPGAVQILPGITDLHPSVQLIRGGEVRDFVITLLARPANLQGGRVWQRNATASRLADADSTFDLLWSERFEEPGLTSDRLDAEAMWRMER